MLTFAVQSEAKSLLFDDHHSMITEALSGEGIGRGRQTFQRARNSEQKKKREINKSIQFTTVAHVFAVAEKTTANV